MSETTTTPVKETKTAKDTPSSDTKKSTEASSSSTEGSAETGSKKSAGASRPVSYFSSVSTDEYRSGWQDIFGGAKKNGRKSPTKAKPAQASKARNQPILPMTVELQESDLDAELQELLGEALRRRAKRDKLALGRVLKTAKLSWRVECDISK